MLHQAALRLIKIKKMFKFLLSICFVISFVGIKAQDINYNNLQLENEEYHVTIPYEYVKGQIFLPITIKGCRYRFCFDTGSPTMISKKVVNVVKCKELEKTILYDINLKKDSVRNVLLPELKLADLVFKDIPTTILSDVIDGCDELAGIIGANLFRNSIVLISHKNKTISITNDWKKIPVKNKYRNLMHLPENRNAPFVRVEFRNGKNKGGGEFIFDTGDSRLLNVNTHFVDFFTEKQVLELVDSTYGKGAIGFNGVSEDTIQKRYRVSELKVNKASIYNISTDHSRISSIGCELIEYGDVLLDFKNKSFGFVPYEEQTSSRQKYWPIDFTFNRNRIEIAAIWDESLQGIEVGDQLIEIDGVNLGEVDMCDFINKDFFNKKAQVSLLIVNNQGEKKKFKISRLEL